MACTDVQTIQAGNGTKTQFSFDFPYIFKSEIHVYFWNAVTKEYDEKLTTDATYPWQITNANPTIVEFTGTAPPSPSAPTDPNEPTVDNVKIRRITKVDDIRALFNPGSAIRSDDLNTNFEQLRYAIQESNCAGISDELDQYLKDYYWDRYDNTLYDGDTWVSDDTKIATTAALDARFQDEVNDTLTKAELAAGGNTMPDNDNAVPTTGAVNDYINEVITNDIAGSDGVSITDDGDGTITVGLTDDSVDFDKIKDADQIKLADQAGDYAIVGTDDKVFTSSAAIRRFENYVQTSTPTPTAGIGKGAVWLDNDQDLTLSVWGGSSWIGVASGGTFTNQPKVVYVDATSGLDSNDGHRISRPKQTIKAAINQINADSTFGDGSVVIVAPGVYQEVAPIQIQKKNVSIIGQALRSCIVHPTVATQGDQSSGNHALFELNSGSFIQNLTLTGMKAGTGTGNSVDSVLPTAQGWNFAFYANAIITKSPYIQNCTNFSDSEIDNSNLNANTPAGGLAGDLDSAPTGGGMLIDGSVVDSASPLRSMVADSYTHVGLNGPGILVTMNGYAQCTSSYAFFNKYHIKALNGGQANLAASTTDFGEKALVADGRSYAPIFSASTTTAAADGDITFTIDAPVADASWHGSAERPASNMLVTINSVTYPVLSSTANGSGWNVTISRPNPSQKSENLGLNGALTSGITAYFFLRSLIASSGHTMEYVGSGTDYRALPENGGVPDDTNQITELNDGKIWTATTDHNGKFTVGPLEVDQRSGAVTIATGSSITSVVADPSPQLGGDLDVNGNKIITTSNGDVVIDPNGTGAVKIGDTSGGVTSQYLEITDSQIKGVGYGGALNLNAGASGINLLAQLTSALNTNIDIYPRGTGNVDFDPLGLGGTRLVGIDDPTGAQDAATKNYVDTTVAGVDTTQIIQGNTSATVTDTGTDGKFVVTTEGAERVRVDSSGNVGVGTTNPQQRLHTRGDSDNGFIGIRSQNNNGITGLAGIEFSSDSTYAKAAIAQQRGSLNGRGDLAFYIDSSDDASDWSTSDEKLRITQEGKVGIGTSAAVAKLNVSSGDIALTPNVNADDLFLENTGSCGLTIGCGTDQTNNIYFAEQGVGVSRGAIVYDTSGDYMAFSAAGLVNERMRIDSSGNVGIGSDNPSEKLVLAGVAEPTGFSDTAISMIRSNYGGRIAGYIDQGVGHGITFDTINSATPTERMRINADGDVLLGQNTESRPGNGNTVKGAAFEKTTNGMKLYLSQNSGTALNANRNNDGTLMDLRRSGNQVGRINVTSSAASYLTTSDYRLKENVVVLDGAISRVKQLLPKRFNFVQTPNETVDGFIAHEAQSVVPESVSGVQDGMQDEEYEVTPPVLDEDGNVTEEAVMGTRSVPDYQGIDQAKLVPLLTAALQEAIAKIETLETKVAVLEAAT